MQKILEGTNVILPTNAENNMDRASEKRGSFKKNENELETASKN